MTIRNLCIGPLLMILVGCGSPARPEAPVSAKGDREDLEPTLVDAIEIPRTRTGDIARAELIQHLDAGVGAFLTTLEVRAHAPDGRFAGWEVRRFSNEWVDLVPGDIIHSVNGMPIETPTQVQTLWKTLRTAPVIVVSGTRQGQPLELRFEVQGAIQPTSP